MFKNPASMALAVLALAVAARIGMAEQPPKQITPPSPGIATAKLSPPLRAALIEEMQQVDRALQRGVSHAAKGEWPQLAEAADSIAGAFILKRKLTDAQREELERALPGDFLALDQKFHTTAERLAAAARASDPELALFYTSRLLEACTSCHGRFAAQRFPGLAAAQEPASHTHR